jgi:hypothetical protein
MLGWKKRAKRDILIALYFLAYQMEVADRHHDEAELERLRGDVRRFHERLAELEA